MKTSSLGPLTPGPDCDQFAALLPLLPSGEFADDAAAGMRAHVASCRWCQQRLREYTSLDTALRRQIAALSTEFPTVSLEGVVERVDRQEMLNIPPTPGADAPRRPPPARRVVAWMAPLAAVLVVIVLTVAIFAARGAPSTRLPFAATPIGSTPTATPASGGPASAVLYTLVTDSAGASRIWALRLSDGKALWQSRQSGSLSALVSDQGVVYAVLGDSGSASVLALRTSDGSVLWQSQPLKTQFEPALAAANGVVYFENGVYHQGDQGVPPLTVAPAITAFRGSDGHMLWRYAAPDRVVSPPLVLGDTLYLGVGTGVVAVRVSNGTQRWRASLVLQSWPFQEWLTGDGSGIYAFVGERSVNDASIVASLYALRAMNGASLWQVGLARGGQDAVAAPVVADGVVYVEIGSYYTSSVKGVPSSYSVVLYALRATDGAPLWRYEPPSFSETLSISTSALLGEPILVNGVLYFIDGAGSLRALRANDQKLLWQRSFPDAAFDPLLAVTDQTVFVQTSSSILALRISDGGIIWQQPTSAPGA